MTRKTFIVYFFVLSSFIAAFQYVGMYFSLYWLIEWFDILMHFLGGLWVATIAYIIFHFGKNNNQNGPSLIFSMIMCTFFVGLMWEWFELKKGLVSILEDDYLLDTLMDILLDLIGAVIVCFSIYKKNLI